MLNDGLVRSDGITFDFSADRTGAGNNIFTNTGTIVGMGDDAVRFNIGDSATLNIINPGTITAYSQGIDVGRSTNVCTADIDKGPSHIRPDQAIDDRPVLSAGDTHMLTCTHPHAVPKKASKQQRVNIAYV